MINQERPDELIILPVDLGDLQQPDYSSTTPLLELKETEETADKINLREEIVKSELSPQNVIEALKKASGNS